MGTLARPRVIDLFTVATMSVAPVACGSSHDASAPDAAAHQDGGTGARDGGTDGGGTHDAAVSPSDSGGTTRDARPPGGDATAPVGEYGMMCPKVSPGDVESYDLPPTTGLPAGVSAMTNWMQHGASGGWNGRQVKDACRYQADPGGFLTWHGMRSARVEVDPGDDPLALGENTERGELLTLQDAAGDPFNETAASGKKYYATSYYFPTTWSATFYPYSAFEASGSTWPAGTTSDCSSGSGTQCNSWSFVMQFHSPSVAWAGLAAASTAPGQPQTMWLSAGSDMFAFSDGGKLLLGKWTDLVLSIDWSSGGIEMWRRNEGETAFTAVISGTTSAPPPTDGTYMKQGLYRGGNVNGRTDVYWVGPTARGTTFAAVEQAVFGTSSGP
jgi:Polysaccharide lyase